MQCTLHNLQRGHYAKCAAIKQFANFATIFHFTTDVVLFSVQLSSAPLQSCFVLLYLNSGTRAAAYASVYGQYGCHQNSLLRRTQQSEVVQKRDQEIKETMEKFFVLPHLSSFHHSSLPTVHSRRVQSGTNSLSSSVDRIRQCSANFSSSILVLVTRFWKQKVPDSPHSNQSCPLLSIHATRFASLDWVLLVIINPQQQA